jgi:hypothetical protein
MTTKAASQRVIRRFGARNYKAIRNGHSDLLFVCCVYLFAWLRREQKIIWGIKNSPHIELGSSSNGHQKFSMCFSRALFE